MVGYVNIVVVVGSDGAELACALFVNLNDFLGWLKFVFTCFIFSEFYLKCFIAALN